MVTNLIHFSKSTVLNLPLPDKGFVTYRDAKEPGLSLYITASGAKTFFIRKRIDGRDERLKIGPFPSITVEQARRTAQEYKGIVATGKDPHKEKKAQIRNSQTFGEMFDEYMTRYSKKHKKSWKYDEREINRFLPHWFNKRLSSITRADIQSLHEKIYDNNGLYQANRLLERIRGIYNKAIEWGWEGQNPVIGIKKYKEISRDRFVQPNEMACLLRSLEAEENLTVRDFLLMLLFTGARKTNTLMMRWNEINWDTHEWRIPETKNGEPLLIPISKRAIEILKRRYRLSESSWVFPQDGNPSKYFNDPKKGWARTLERATFYLWLENDKLSQWMEDISAASTDLPAQYHYKEAIRRAKNERIELPRCMTDIRMHDIRRTFGSYQAISGASLQIIGRSLGHKSTQATQIYARLNLDPVRASIEKATESMLQLIDQNLQPIF